MKQIKRKTDYTGYLTPLSSQPESTVRKIPQPVKIAQLLGLSGQLQGQKDSNIKISLPERITPYLKKTSSQKKNVTDMKLFHNERNVRRNLNFTKIPISATEIKRCVKVDTNNENDNPKKGKLHLARKKSFLLPPNTIKESHIKNRFKRNRSEMSRYHILTVNSENINSKLSEISENSSSQMENANARADSVAHVKKNKTSIIQNISSQMVNVNEQSGINILHFSYSDLADTGDNPMEKNLKNLNSNEISNVNIICGSQNNDRNVTINGSHSFYENNTVVKIDANLRSDDVDQNNIRAERYSFTVCISPDREEIKETSLIKKVEKERCSSTIMNIYEDLQNIKMLNELGLNLQHSNNESEHVILSKTELTLLESKLKHLVCRLEEDVSDVKLILTTITKLLFAKNEEIKCNNETKITQQKTEITENLNDNMKVMDNTNTKSSCIIDMKYNNALKKIYEIFDIDRSNFLEMNRKEVQPFDEMYIASENNKENKETLNSPIIKQSKKLNSGTKECSTRLRAKVLKHSNAASDSFVKLENTLGIVNKKSNTPITPLINQTPAKNKHKNKEIEGRPMKEYMALKSRMSCLLTPNIKRFNHSEANNIHRETDDAKISVSDKLFAELRNLYEDSL